MMLPRLPLAVLTACLTAAIATAEDPDETSPDRLPIETVRGVDGKTIRLEAPEDGALAVVFLWTECPISNQYSPTLNGLAERFGPDGLRLVGLFVDADRTDEEVAAHAEEYDLDFPVARAGAVRLARELGVETVPAALLIDADGAIRYRGRIDNGFFAIGRKRIVVTEHDLRDAIDAVLSGMEVERPRTEAVGCTLPDFGIEE